MTRKPWRMAGASLGVLAMLLAQTPLAAQPASAPAAPRQWRNYPQPPAAPRGAPNVLLIMTDDVGFAASSTFGGPIATPVFDQLADHGLRYNNFHTTAMCSPTRAALLTGRNHHSVASGVIADVSTDDAGYTSVIPDNAATVGEGLREHGYSTAWFGKNHNTPKWENTPVGPYDHWPNAMGFDYFYGFNGPLADQFSPNLIENRNAIDPPRSADYIFDKDMADHAVHWLQVQHTVAADKPFFLYYAPGSAHAPHHAPKAWIDKFKGQFDQGWDKMREESFARQKRLGVIPASALLTPRPAQIPAWDSLTPAEKKVASRLMEDYAAALAYCDDQIGRILGELRRSGQLDNTLVIFLQGDNGASEEDFAGSSNDLAAIAGIEGDTAHMLAHLDELGGPKSFENYPAGWAWSMDTPFQWAKQVASHFGGTRNGLVISWQGHIDGHGEVRSQFHHVIDIAPTIYQATGVRPPASVHGVAQKPLEGVSMVYSFDHPAAPSPHASQYFEMLGNRGYYQDGWIASTTPQRMPWSHAAQKNAALSYKWELYDLHNDFSQAHDLAKFRPDKLKALQAGFAAAARRYNVEPLNDDFIGRIDPALRPSQVVGRSAFVYYPGQTRYPDGAAPMMTKSWRLTASIDTSAGPADGAMIMRGGWFGGWGLMAKGGRPIFIYKSSDLDGDSVRIEAPQPLTPGRHEVEVDFIRQPGPNAPARAVLKIDGAEAASAGVRRTGSTNGDLYVGRSGLTPLVEGLDLPSTFSGKLDKVTIKLDK